MSPRTREDIARQPRLVANLWAACPASAISYVEDIGTRAEKAFANATGPADGARAFALLLTSLAATDALSRLNAGGSR